MSQSKKISLSFLLCITLILFSLPLNNVSAVGSISFIILSKYSAVVNVADEFHIIAITSNGSLPTWKSSNSKIASVNTYGKVTAKKSGSVSITAKIKNAEVSCNVRVNKTTITISKSNATIERGESLKLSASTSNNSPVIWKSNKKSIATISENGTIIGIKPGEATITATADGSVVSCQLKVKSPTITLDKTSIKLYRGQKSKLSAAVSSGIPPVWKTNKESVAFVDGAGAITAVKNGTAIITATVDGISKKCEVIVQKPVITLSPTELNLKKGATASIAATVSSCVSPTWSSSNQGIASVDSAGRVTALKKGTAYIYASEDGAKARCVVRVTE